MIYFYFKSLNLESYNKVEKGVVDALTVFRNKFMW